MSKIFLKMDFRLCSLGKNKLVMQESRSIEAANLTSQHFYNFTESILSHLNDRGHWWVSVLVFSEQGHNMTLARYLFLDANLSSELDRKCQF